MCESTEPQQASDTREFTPSCSLFSTDFQWVQVWGRGAAATSEKSIEPHTDLPPLQKKSLKAAGGRSANSVVSGAQVKGHHGWGKGKDTSLILREE